LLCLLFQSFTKQKEGSICFDTFLVLKTKQDVALFDWCVHPDYQNKPSQQSFSANTTIPSKG
jgi:hypothetical protein